MLQIRALFVKSQLVSQHTVHFYADLWDPGTQWAAAPYSVCPGSATHRDGHLCGTPANKISELDSAQYLTASMLLQLGNEV